MTEGREWAGTTYGNQWMHARLISLLRIIDVRWVYVFAAVFIVPVCLLINSNHSRTFTYRYLRRRIGQGRLKAAWNTYVNHCLFSQVVIDRFAMYAGKRFRVEVEGYGHFKALEKGEAGFVMLSSHIGNYEIAGYTLRSEHKAMDALVFGGEKATVMAERGRLLGGDNIHLIPVLPDMSHLFLINNALADGHIVSMPADRVVGSNKTVAISFLGGEAKFPLGPLRVVTMRGLDVLAVNVMKTSAKAYTAYVSPLTYDKAAPRDEQVRQLAVSYVAELERRVRQYPAQWYNYFDFWT